MSMNIHLKAALDGMFIPDNKKLKKRHISIVEKFSCIQTPTDITKQILKSKDPEEEYKKWVLNISEDEECPIYADDDYSEEGEPIGIEKYNFGEEHLQELDEFKKKYSGYLFKWYEM